ncbi:hypothetical protein [Arthrobacter sp. GMC3]|uniref:hypothetical protein n=1 Tax=Arthrobacter sp. GMC3 TaxID=2058894 RepID=UPI0015E315F9|nr:hypothetical protein [Arthrobacter sp. GMC3]
MTQAALFPKTELPRQRKPKDAWLNALPNWLADSIEFTIPRLGTTANLIPCHKCGVPVLQALDWDHDYTWATTTDTTLLTTNQELQALIQGRTTHELRIVWDGITINHRNTWNLATRDANHNKHPIAPNHQCHQPLGIPIPWELLFPDIKTASIPPDPDQPPPF